MTTEVEREVLLQQVDVAERAVGARLLKLLKGLIDARDVRLVVLGVVKLHDLAGYVRIESAIVIWELGKCVVGHASSLGRRAPSALMFSCRSAFNPQCVSRSPRRKSGAHGLGGGPCPTAAGQARCPSLSQDTAPSERANSRRWHGGGAHPDDPQRA